jgi:hypothetical protein
MANDKMAEGKAMIPVSALWEMQPFPDIQLDNILIVDFSAPRTVRKHKIDTIIVAQNSQI